MPPGDRLGRDRRAQGDVVHVDEVAAQRLDVDLRPIGVRIRLQQGDDLLDGGECRLPGLARDGGRGAMRRRREDA
jgi:hypothetical protein